MGIAVREDALEAATLSKRTVAYDELVTCGPVRTSRGSRRSGHVALGALSTIPNVTVSRGAGANAGATVSDTGRSARALVVETNTEDAIGTLPDRENDYLRYAPSCSRLRCCASIDSRWATESDTSTLTVGDGDDAVSLTARRV